ncbi:hypothetical protein BDZ89DRAFT_1037236 [Hymenopellis radicata]|nr:hypothetical protein BDZ89DRAFT_1037236 [Hymenopellis radicata]
MLSQKVHLQQTPFSNAYAISPELAAESCSTLGVEGVLQRLNQIARTSTIFDQSTKDLLKPFIVQGQDFGSVYAHVRSSWPAPDETVQGDDLSKYLKGLESLGSVFDRARETSISGTRSPNLSLSDQGDYGIYFWAISHSWTDDMEPVDTPVNAFEWPVPLPRGVALEDVRTELLHLGAEYVWLDILCLRQKCDDGHREALRQKEWAIDVPTIGNVYVNGAVRVVRYMNGLGRVLSREGWNHPRHWFNRAWTLQEIRIDSIIGGLPKGMDEPLEERSLEDGTVLGNRLRFAGELEAIQESEGFRAAADFMRVVEAMRRRFSTNPLDKIAGIAMFFRSSTLPVYRESISIEESWTLCSKHLPLRLQAELLFCFPVPGDESHSWRPSWKQLMSGTVETFSTTPIISRLKGIRADGNACYEGPTFRARYQPPPPAAPGESRQRAAIIVENGGKLTTFNVSVHHQVGASIKEGTYTLVGEEWLEVWVMCRSASPDSLHKVTVLSMSEEEAERLKSLEVLARSQGTPAVKREDVRIAMGACAIIDTRDRASWEREGIGPRARLNDFRWKAEHVFGQVLQALHLRPTTKETIRLPYETADPEVDLKEDKRVLPFATSSMRRQRIVLLGKAFTIRRREPWCY